MRTVAITLYHYHELPTLKAKKRAKDWLLTCLHNDPPWVCEHQESCEAAIAWANSLPDSCFSDTRRSDDILQTPLDLFPSKDCPFTGYADDCIARDVAEAFTGCTREKLIRDMRNAFDAAWQSETASWEDEGYIGDQMAANGYEFTEQGKKGTP